MACLDLFKPELKFLFYINYYCIEGVAGMWCSECARSKAKGETRNGVVQGRVAVMMAGRPAHLHESSIISNQSTPTSRSTS